MGYGSMHNDLAVCDSAVKAGGHKTPGEIERTEQDNATPRHLAEEPRAVPGSSASGETACRAVDPGSIPGSGRSPGKGDGNPLQYSCLQV